MEPHHSALFATLGSRVDQHTTCACSFHPSQSGTHATHIGSVPLPAGSRAHSACSGWYWTMPYTAPTLTGADQLKHPSWPLDSTCRGVAEVLWVWSDLQAAFHHSSSSWTSPAPFDTLGLKFESKFYSASEGKLKKNHKLKGMQGQNLRSAQGFGDSHRLLFLTCLSALENFPFSLRQGNITDRTATIELFL